MRFRKGFSVQNVSQLLTLIYYSFPTTFPYLIKWLKDQKQFKVQFKDASQYSALISSHLDDTFRGQLCQFKHDFTISAYSGLREITYADKKTIHAVLDMMSTLQV